MGPMALWLVCLKMWLINGLLKLDLSQQDVSAFESRDHLSSVMILHCCSVVALGTLTPRSRTRSLVGRNGTPCKVSFLQLAHKKGHGKRDATLFGWAITGIATRALLLYWLPLLRIRKDSFGWIYKRRVRSAILMLGLRICPGFEGKAGPTTNGRRNRLFSKVSPCFDR